MNVDLGSMIALLRQGWTWIFSARTNATAMAYEPVLEEKIHRLNELLARAERYRPGNAGRALRL